MRSVQFCSVTTAAGSDMSNSLCPLTGKCVYFVALIVWIIISVQFERNGRDLLKNRERVFNLRSHYDSYRGSFILYEDCLRVKDVAAAAVLRPKIKGTLCTISASACEGWGSQEKRHSGWMVSGWIFGSQSFWISRKLKSLERQRSVYCTITLLSTRKVLFPWMFCPVSF
jgi:hypothetical protein